MSIIIYAERYLKEKCNKRPRKWKYQVCISMRFLGRFEDRVCKRLSRIEKNHNKEVCTRVQEGNKRK